VNREGLEGRHVEMDEGIYPPNRSAQIITEYDFPKDSRAEASAPPFFSSPADPRGNRFLYTSHMATDTAIPPPQQNGQIFFLLQLHTLVMEMWVTLQRRLDNKSACTPEFISQLHSDVDVNRFNMGEPKLVQRQDVPPGTGIAKKR
jgi:hypothetical protein